MPGIAYREEYAITNVINGDNNNDNKLGFINILKGGIKIWG